MEITEVRVKLVEKSRERLRAFCSITFDGAFVVRDIKVIGSGTGPGVFVAMPSRKLCDRCPRCRAKNHLRARFCNECGHKLGDHRVARDPHGRAKIHADVAHPINTECREMIQAAVMKAYQEELERSKSPDYRPPKLDEADEAFAEELDVVVSEEVDEQASLSGDRAAAGELVETARSSESAFSDYDSLIAELKQEAAGRQDRRRDRRWGRQQPGDRPAREPVPAQAHVPSPAKAQEGRMKDDRRERAASPSQPAGGHPGTSCPEPSRKQSADAEPATPSVPAKGSTEPVSARRDDDVFGAGLS